MMSPTRSPAPLCLRDGIAIAPHGEPECFLRVDALLVRLRDNRE